ncbi:MAG: Gfo/Idh/MocA family protein [Sedimentisphaeraceae bacterium JB056]
MRKAKIGIIGAGHFVRGHHLETARKSDLMEIRAVADIIPERLNKFTEIAPIGYTTFDYKKLLDDEEIDIVIIGTKQDLHAKMIVESLDAGKWVYCEKPMSQNEEESQMVLDAEKRNPGKLAIGFNRRFSPAIQKIRQLMANEKRPWYIDYILMSPALDYNKPGSYYANQPRILYEGCHILDLLCWMLGTAPSSVYMTGNIHNNCCIIGFDDGSQVSFTCGSTGSWCLYKEMMHIFCDYKSIAMTDFIDLKIRGFKGEFDKVYPPFEEEYKQDVLKYGYDYWEALTNKRAIEYKDEKYSTEKYYKQYGIYTEKIKRPVPIPKEPVDYGFSDPEFLVLHPDKGWKNALEHFVECFITNQEPENANGSSGYLSTLLAEKLLESMHTGKPIPITCD